MPGLGRGLGYRAEWNVRPAPHTGEIGTYAALCIQACGGSEFRERDRSQTLTGFGPVLLECIRSGLGLTG